MALKSLQLSKNLLVNVSPFLRKTSLNGSLSMTSASQLKTIHSVQKRSFFISRIHLNLKEFEQSLKQSKEPVIVDFYANWCGPCRMLAPILERVVKEQNGKVKLMKIDVDEDTETAQTYNVSSLPTVMAFKEGKPVDSFIGLRDATFIQKFIEKLSQK